jgi:peptidyl-tRNA hydrolase, PTH1 family
VGLGNPGPEYEGTRHNAGFDLADHLAARWNMLPFRRSESGRETHGRVGNEVVRIIKPQTYMNRSGAALAPLRALLDFDHARDLLILVDEVALPVGRFRLRGAGSAGGHNGLKSVEGALHAQDYSRLRIGVGPFPSNWDDLADFVLSRFTRDERDQVLGLMDPMAEAVECWVESGIETAMNQFNRKGEAES